MPGHPRRGGRNRRQPTENDEPLISSAEPSLSNPTSAFDAMPPIQPGMGRRVRRRSAENDELQLPPLPLAGPSLAVPP
jgi:hypothetical protein